MSLNETINNLGDSIINLVDKKTHRGLMALDQGEVMYDKEVFEDIKKYKHSTFDIEKVRPLFNASSFGDMEAAIDENGVYQGRPHRYIGHNWTSVDLADGDEFCVEFKLRTGTLVTHRQFFGVIWRAPNILFGIDASNHFIVIQEASMEQATALDTISANTVYYCKVIQTTTYTEFQYSTDNENFNTLRVSRTITSCDSIQFGERSYDDVDDFEGAIYRDITLTLNGEPYTTGKSMMAYKLTNTDGWYSGFDGGIGIHFWNNRSFANVSSLKFHTRFKFNSNFLVNEQIRPGESTITFNEDDKKIVWFQRTANWTGFWVAADNEPHKIWVSGEGVSGQHVGDVLETDKWHEITIESDGKSYIKFTINGKEYTVNTDMSTFAITQVSLGRVLDIDTPVDYIDLKETYLYINGEEVCNFNKSGVDIIKEDTFEIHGSPVITTDGILDNSNITVQNNKTSDYISQHFNNFPVNNKIALSCDFYLPDTTGGTILGCNCEISGNGEFYCGFVLGNGTISFVRYGKATTEGNDWYFNIPNIGGRIVPGKKYSIYGEMTKDYSYIKVSFDGQTFERKGYYPTQQELYPLHSVTYGAISSGFYPVKCKINLNTTKLYVDDKLITQPCLRIPYTETKAGYKVAPMEWRTCLEQLKEEKGFAPYYTLDNGDEEAFYKVGSPRISNKILSNSTAPSNNHVQLYESRLKTITSKIFETKIKVSNGGFLKEGETLANFIDGGLFWGYITLGGPSGTFYIQLMSSWDGINRSLGGKGFPIDTWALLRWEYDPVKGVRGILCDESGDKYITPWNSSGNIQNLDRDTINVLRNTYDKFSVNDAVHIDLANTKLYVDGELIWTPYTRPSYTLPMGDVYSVLSAKANSSEIAHYALPSNNYEDLTIPEEAATVVAPGDGYFQLSGTSSGSNQWVSLHNTTTLLQSSSWATNSNDVTTCNLPVKKGDQVSVHYSVGTIHRFRFIPLEGSKGE